MNVEGKNLAAMALFLAACSGGGSGDPAPPAVPPGKVDVSYGIGGRVTTSLGMSAAAVDAEGNAYVTGGGVAKFDRAGMQVAGYGGSVIPKLERAPVTDAAGNLFTIANDGAVVKRDPSGQLSVSFGSAGRAQVTPWVSPGFFSGLTGLHRDAQGNLLVVGLYQGPLFSFNFVAVAKLDTAGQLVGSFGDGGKKVTDVNLHPFLQRVDSTLDPHGNLIVAAQYFDSQWEVAKLDAQGNRAAGFGQGGTWNAPSCSADGTLAVAADAAGNIYVGISCEGLPTIFKLDAQGIVVGSFGSVGRAVGFFPMYGNIGAVLPASDGTLYVSGAVPTAQGAQLAVAKLSANGSLDAAFGLNGIMLPGARAGDGGLLALDASGLLYVGGVNPEIFSVPTAPIPYVIFRLGG